MWDKVKEVILEQNSKQAPSAKMQLQQNSKQGREAPSTLMQLQLQTRVGSMMGKYHWGGLPCLLCTLDPGRLRAHHYAGRICHNYYVHRVIIIRQRPNEQPYVHLPTHMLRR